MNYLKFFSLSLIAALMFPIAADAQTKKVETVTPTVAQKMIQDGALMVDVREADEVAELAYYTENVINIPLSEFESRLDEIPKDKELIMACRSGNRSGKAATILMEKGYENPLNLEGGIIAWEAGELAVVKDGKKVGGAKGACCSKGSGKKDACGTSKKSSGKGCCSSKGKKGRSCGSKAKVGTN